VHQRGFGVEQRRVVFLCAVSYIPLELKGNLMSKLLSLRAALAPALLCAGAALHSLQASAQGSAAQEIKNVLLVHGAFADGSSWAKVIAPLQAKGYHVVAVQIPLTSLADDVAAVGRAIKLETGPVLLVGHSYGGVVITEAGNDPKVAGLVYVAAYALDTGESILSVSKAGPAAPLNGEIRPDSAGFLKVTDKGIQEDFAQDLPLKERQVLAATQVPVALSAMGGQVTQPAWKSKPSWFIIASSDRAIPPQYEQMMAARMKATTTSAPSSHVVMLSQPLAVVSTIEKAAHGQTHQAK
jgi:pimeloyl-ACP methyl ester carboxylesterase